MADAGDIITRALRSLGAFGSGETPDSTTLGDGLEALNGMLESWRTEKLFVPSITRTTETLTASKDPHTIGSGGDINTTRPVRIEKASIIVTGTTDTEYPMRVLDYREYSRLVQKSIETNIPYLLYYEPTFPLGNIHLYPVPNEANDIALYVWEPLTTYATTGTAVSVPPGYERAMVRNLAIELAPEFGIEPTQALQRMAIESKAQVKRLNVRTPKLATNYPPSNEVSWDIDTGRHLNELR